MASAQRPFLLDVTRLISRSWTRRQSTGIDRVSYAYLRHFRERALSVVQHRGVVRALGPRRSDKLFDLLLASAKNFRTDIAAFAPAILTGELPRIGDESVTYINVGHTDFDLEQHHQWIKRSRLQSAYFIHDLIPIQHPALSRPHAVKRHLGRVTSALRHASGIIVSSNAVARDLASFAEARNLSVPPLLIAPLAGAELRSEVRAEAPAHPYFLCVGTIEPRKNHQLLLDVWRQLAKRMGEAVPKLVIVGQTGPMSDDALFELTRNDELKDKVELITKCSDARLASLMAGAQALLMPTLAEGFGLPLVEALQGGTAVIASDIPIFREIGQGIPLLLDAGDQLAWGKAIEDYTALSPDALRREQGLAAFNPPKWPDHFAQLEAWLDEPGIASAGNGDLCLSA